MGLAADSDADTNPVDEVAVRDFLGLLHEQAATALDGVTSPGVMNLLRFLPDRGFDSVFRFPVGDISGMADQAIADAAAGFNVYCEGRTVRPGLGRKLRGSACVCYASPRPKEQACIATFWRSASSQVA